MANILRYRAVWTNIPSGSGISTFYARDDTTPQVFADAVRAFLLDALGTSGSANFLGDGVTIVPDPVVDVINDTDGELFAAFAVTAPAPITTTPSGGYAAPAGACITWRTGAILRGHRVRGRTFLVPLNGTAFENNGTLGTAFQSQLVSAAQAYIASLVTPVVFVRPFAGASGPPPIPAHTGSSHEILVGTVTDKAAVLTSRRD